MKRIRVFDLGKALSIFLFIVSLFSCERIISVKNNLFTAEIVYDQNTVVLDAETEMKVEIKPMMEVSTTVYYFSYKLLEGDGHFLDKDNNKINENTQFMVGDMYHLITSYTFVPTSVGTIRLQLNFFDNKEQSFDKEISYTCDYYLSDFTFDAYPLSETSIVGEATAINFTLNESDKKRGEEKGAVNYNMKFETSSNGTFSYNGQEYIENQVFSVLAGSFSGTYTGEAEASHDIVFTVTNDNHTPQSRSADFAIDYSYYQSNFTFTAEAVDENALVGDPVVIDFSLIELLKEEVAYTMVYENSKAGTFIYNGTEYSQGETISIEPGNFQGIYTGSTDGDHGLTFTVNNDNMHPQSHSDNVTVSYTWYQSDFYIMAISTTGSANIGDSVRIDFELTEYLKENVKYTMFYQSNGAGTFTYNGTTYYATQSFSIQPGNFFGNYIGTDAQTHEIIFKVRNDNYNPIEHEAEVEIIFQDTDFDIVIDAENRAAYPYEYASYGFQIIGGGSTATTACLQNLGPGTDGGYMINGVNYQNDWCGQAPPANIIGVTNNAMKIKKSNTGVQNFRLNVTKNGITKYVDLTLTCEAPPFEISDMHLSAQYQWWDASINVYSTITSGYTLPTNFTYVYKIGTSTMATDSYTDLTLPQTKVKTIALNEGLGAGEKTVSVTISNAYGYSQTASVPLTLLDPRPVVMPATYDYWTSYESQGYWKTFINDLSITGDPARGDYCESYHLEYWHPQQFQWIQYGLQAWVPLVNNHSLVDMTISMPMHNPPYSITLLRVQVKDEDGRVSEYREIPK